MLTQGVLHLSAPGDAEAHGDVVVVLAVVLFKRIHAEIEEQG